MRNIDGSCDVLLVEDHPGDVRLTKEALHHHGPIRLHHAWDGVEAMDFLRRKGAHVDAPRPHLILLDLNLPKMDGREVLGLIKSDARLQAIPTIVLTTSDTEGDVLACYKLHANCYLRKPAQWDVFDNLMKHINLFWLPRARLRVT